MNKVLEFIKGNLVVVISVVLILAFLPAGYIFAGKWNTKVHDEAKGAYDKEKRTLTSAGAVSYSLPAVLEGEADLSESRAPNNAVTEFYKAHKAEREQQVRDVVDRGTAFNQGDHVELVPGILPEAPDDRTLVRLGREMAETIVGTGSSPSIYQRKLQRLNAGSPPDPQALAATLESVRDEQQRLYESSNADGKITPEQSQQLQKDLVARRLGEYIGRSKALTFYCSPAALVTDGRATGGGGSSGSSSGNAGYSPVPSAMPQVSTIDETMVFRWLWDYWMISDVLDAAASANTDPRTGAQAIPDAPVKSIESVRLSKIQLPEAASTAAAVDDPYAGGGRDPRSGSYGSDPAPGAATGGPEASLTGRVGGQPNSAFDIRTIRVVAVVSSKDLPRFLDAIGKTNYMTVTDLDLQEVQVWDDLEQGYYYGDEHVMRATMTIESVWLRSWMAPMMPDRVKLALGIPVLGGDGEQESDG